MILRRIGNKNAIANKIIPYFPAHKIYIEPFFGAGGIFFNKPKVKYNIVNDLDSDVFNLFMVIINQKEELEKAFYHMPIHTDLLKYWKKNQETDPIKKALRFLFLSNFTFMCKGNTMTTGTVNPKSIFFDRINNCFDYIFDTQFLNCDFKRFFIEARINNIEQTFIYCDPPYLNTDDNYSNSFKENDSVDLFNILQKTGCKYAMSEFDNPFIIQQAKERNLNINIIGERRNLENRKTEILITNYKNNPTLFP